MRMVAAAEKLGRGLAQAESHLGGHRVRVGGTANPVGAEQLTLHLRLPKLYYGWNS